VVDTCTAPVSAETREVRLYHLTPPGRFCIRLAKPLGIRHADVINPVMSTAKYPPENRAPSFPIV